MNREEGIRIIAYHIWEEEGGSCHGNDVQNWLKAETIWQERNKPSRTTSETGPSAQNQRGNPAANIKPTGVVGTQQCGRVQFSKRKP
jgi:hypothetical protein